MNEALAFLSFRYLFNSMFYLNCLNVIIRAMNYCYYYNVASNIIIIMKKLL